MHKFTWRTACPRYQLKTLTPAQQSLPPLYRQPIRLASYNRLLRYYCSCHTVQWNSTFIIVCSVSHVHRWAVFYSCSPLTPFPSVAGSSSILFVDINRLHTSLTDLQSHCVSHCAVLISGDPIIQNTLSKHAGNPVCKLQLCGRNSPSLQSSIEFFAVIEIEYYSFQSNSNTINTYLHKANHLSQFILHGINMFFLTTKYLQACHITHSLSLTGN